MTLRRRLMMLGVVSIVTIGLLDVVLRLMLNSPIYQVGWPENNALSRFARNASEDATQIGDLGRVTADRSDDVPRRVRTTIDELGFRNEPSAAHAPIDLVVLGDSYGFGVGTTQEKTFAQLLRQRQGLNVYNLSLPYTGPWAQYANLTIESPHLQLRPGAVVLWTIFTGNDLDDEIGPVDIATLPRNGFGAKAWMQLKRIRNRSPLYQMVTRAGRAIVGGMPAGGVSISSVNFVNGRPALFVQPYVEARDRSREAVAAHPHFRALQDTFTAMTVLTKQLGAALKVVLAPSKEEIYAWLIDKAEPWSSRPLPTGFATAVHDLATSAGIEYLDLTPAFLAESKPHFDRTGEMLWWYDDTHWNEAGHELAATVIARELLARAANGGGRE